MFQPIGCLAQEIVVDLGRLQGVLQSLAQVWQLKIVVLRQQTVEAIAYFAETFVRFNTGQSQGGTAFEGHQIVNTTAQVLPDGFAFLLNGWRGGEGRRGTCRDGLGLFNHVVIHRHYRRADRTASKQVAGHRLVERSHERGS